MSAESTNNKQPEWKSLVNKYQESSFWKSSWQIANTFIPFLTLWVLMYFSLEFSYWITFLLSIPCGGFLVRIFIIQHDCGHGSFFKTKKVNNSVGLICSLFTWTPYYYWQRGHAIHHAHTGNLEKRGIGDIHTMTVSEYKQLSKFAQLKYRLYRNPINLFIIIPTFLFTVFYRFPTTRAKSMKKYESSIYWTNLALAVLVGGIMAVIGWKAFLLVHIPALMVSSAAGTWLFFIQHQFEDTYWAEKKDWDYTKAALDGSSYYKLPKILQWFTGNIGFHHIHHLSSRIPNYRLEQCHRENPMFWNTVVLTIKTSFKSTFLSLWDDEEHRLISFRSLKKKSLSNAGAA